MRRILLLAVAGAASVGASVCGFIAGWRLPAGTHVSVPYLLACVLSALSFPVFALYLRWPRMGVTLAWLLLSGTWFAAFLLRLHVCMRYPCTTVETLRIAWQTIAAEIRIWLLLAASVCLLLDYSEVAVQQLRSRRTAPAAPPPES